jgi:hypothetical protein
VATYYIGADVHTNNTELAIEKRGRIVARYSVPTTIPAISTVLSSLQGKKILAMEEGPMAGWLYRNLNEKVKKFIVSEPRRNKLVTCEGDKDDRIDSGKLAVLLRGNFLKAVDHAHDSHRAHLKHCLSMNEPERIFCYVSIICMSCLGIRQAPDRCLATYDYD